MTAPPFPHPLRRVAGMSLVEVLLALAIAGILFAALTGVLSQGLQARGFAKGRNDLSRQARFAMDQMVRAVSGTRRLLLPLDDKPSTGWRENVREQSVPPSPPEPGSSLATAVLAVTLPRDVDQDRDGFPDADNDRDGRLDEDLPRDWDDSGSPGVDGIDDAGDGTVDNSGDDDDDEYLNQPDEDPINGADDDGDGNVDEDPAADVNGDGCPGLCGVDDDGDSIVDEGNDKDDDEDGQEDEDWYDPVVFYLNGDALIQRTPVPWDENASGGPDGLDFVESVIAEGVTLVRFERVPLGTGRALLVDIALELANPSGQSVRLDTRVRVGGGP